MSKNGGPPTICLIAADVSADQNAARLTAALRRRSPGVKLIGAGGPLMHGAGMDAMCDSSDVSMVGPPDSVRTLRSVVRVWRRLTAMIREQSPDVAVLIDNETLNVLIARWLRKSGIPTVFFFPPQVWFWGRWRLRWMAPYITRVLCAFREEANLYRAAGVDTVWTGHPLRDVVRVRDDSAAAVRAIGLDPGRRLVVLMPGSRPQELDAHCDLMFAAAKILRARDPNLQFAVPIASDALRERLELEARRSGLSDLAIYAPDSFGVMSHAQAILQCAGTATLEAALLGIPSVIVYQCDHLRYAAARRIMYVKYIGMVNILLGEMVQPEFFHWRIAPEQLAAEMWSLMTDDLRRNRIRARLAELADIMGPPGAMDNAAAAVLDLVSNGAGVAESEGIVEDGKADRRMAAAD
ncbi:MAG TPA: lipid-A-disaccharide synthase [Candidatus Binataceae bacterium]|nr:lipid-A-disaccharide synthase [Candidatus Binataceae bacterium]